MNLEITNFDGTVEYYDTKELTVSAPLGGPIAMTRAWAVWNPDGTYVLPGTGGERADAGLLVVITQFEAAGHESFATQRTMAHLGIVPAEEMKKVRLVRRNGAVWLFRDPRTGELLDFTTAHAIGSVFVEEWKKYSVYSGVAEIRETFEERELEAAASGPDAFAGFIGLPKKFIEDCELSARREDDEPGDEAFFGADDYE